MNKHPAEQTRLRAAAFLAALVSIRVAAQEPSPAKSEVEIVMEAVTVTSATRTEKTIDHIPGSVAVVSNNDIALTGLTSQDPMSILAENVPGYSASNDDLTTAGETLRGRRPQYLLDGVPMSTPLRDVGRAGGLTDAAALDRVEVVNGTSAMEGLGGTGGMVNFVSKQPKKEGTTVSLASAVETQLQFNTVGWKTTLTVVHKKEAVDALVSIGTHDRTMYTDAHGRNLPLSANGTYYDSSAKNLLGKLGYTFGANGTQRVQLSASRFVLDGNGNFRTVNGDRTRGLTTTSVRGAPLGQPSAQTIQLLSAQYTHADLAGGSFTSSAFKVKEIMVNNAEIDPAKQDPRYAPIGTLVDQSEVFADKKGLRAFWVRPDLVLDGVELNAGYDYLYDTTGQSLMLTGRSWLPPMEYASHSLYAQVEYERGPFTVRGGSRYQDAKLDVETYQTLYQTSPATFGLTVQGGQKTYTAAVYNMGVVYRFRPGWSTFAGYSEGYDLPDMGSVLRGVTKADQSVNTLIEMDAVVTKNYELGLNWRGRRATLGVTAYFNESDSSTTIITNPVTLLPEISRVPTEKKGFEVSGEWRVTPEFQVSGSYSKQIGRTALAAGMPIDVTSGEQPDKITARLNWAPVSYLRFNVIGTHFAARAQNIGRRSLTGTALDFRSSRYELVSASGTYRTKWGDLSVGIANLTNTYHITNENSTSGSNYFSIRGRNYTISHSITF